MKKISSKFNFPTGKGLFVFSDPGGAKPILSLILLNKIENAYIVSDRYYNFYDWFDLEVNVINHEKDIIPLIDEIKPKYIFTGTSYSSNIEKITLVISKQKKIPSYTYLDQDSNIRLRLNYNSELLYPTYVYYPESISLSKETIKFLKIKTQLHPLKNYFLLYLNKWKSKMTRNEFIQKVFGDNNLSRGVLTVALDPISNLTLSHYDEFLLLDEILSTIQKSKWRNSLIVIKNHPNQKNIKRIESILMKYPSLKLKIWTKTKYDLELLYYSDILIGLYSSILLEAIELGTSIIRYIPFNLEKDPLMYLNKENAKNCTELRMHLNVLNQ